MKYRNVCMCLHIPVLVLRLWRSCIPQGTKWYRFLGGPESGASCKPAYLRTGLWPHEPHLAHETPNSEKETSNFMSKQPLTIALFWKVYFLWRERCSVSHVDDMAPPECAWVWGQKGKERASVGTELSHSDYTLFLSLNPLLKTWQIELIKEPRFNESGKDP